MAAAAAAAVEIYGSGKRPQRRQTSCGSRYGYDIIRGSEENRWTQTEEAACVWAAVFSCFLLFQHRRRAWNFGSRPRVIVNLAGVKNIILHRRCFAYFVLTTDWALNNSPVGPRN